MIGYRYRVPIDKDATSINDYIVKIIIFIPYKIKGDNFF